MPHDRIKTGQSARASFAAPTQAPAAPGTPTQPPATAIAAETSQPVSVSESTGPAGPAVNEAAPIVADSVGAPEATGAVEADQSAHAHDSDVAVVRVSVEVHAQPAGEQGDSTI